MLTYTETLALLGDKCLATENFMIFDSLVTDFFLPKLILLLKQIPAKRHVICHLIYCYIPNDPLVRIKAIKEMYELIDLGELIKCLAILVKYEKEFNNELFDIFIYYATLGTSHSSPYVQQSAFQILSFA